MWINSKHTPAPSLRATSSFRRGSSKAGAGVLFDPKSSPGAGGQKGEHLSGGVEHRPGKEPLPILGGSGQSPGDAKTSGHRGRVSSPGPGRVGVSLWHLGGPYMRRGQLHHHWEHVRGVSWAGPPLQALNLAEGKAASIQADLTCLGGHEVHVCLLAMTRADPGTSWQAPALHQQGECGRWGAAGLGQLVRPAAGLVYQGPKPREQALRDTLLGHGKAWIHFAPHPLIHKDTASGAEG